MEGEQRGERLTKIDIVVNLSEHAYIDAAEERTRLFCACSPFAAEIHSWERRCTCSRLTKDCHLFLGGCEGRRAASTPED